MQRQNTELREVITKLTSVVKTLATNLKGLEERQKLLVLEKTFKEKMDVIETEINLCNSAIDTRDQKNSHKMLEMQEQINKLKEQINWDTENLSKLGTLVTKHMQMNGILGESFMDDSKLGDSRLEYDSEADFGDLSSICEDSQEEESGQQEKQIET